MESVNAPELAIPALVALDNEEVESASRCSEPGMRQCRYVVQRQTGHAMQSVSSRRAWHLTEEDRLFVQPAGGASSFIEL